MGRKRLTALLLAALTALALTGCGAKEDKEKDKDAGMSIQPAQLSEEEAALAELLALGMESYHIFEFQAEGAKFVELDAYELADGSWSRLPGGGGMGLSEGNGRLALTFGKMTEGVRLAVQADGENYASSVQIEPEDDVSGMTFATSTLDDAPLDIELDQEIPLVLQIVTSSNEVRFYKVDYFHMPRELAKQEYEHVYAVTVTFSARELGGAAGPAVPSDEPPAEPSPET